MATVNALQTYNHDVAGFWRRINRFITELDKSVSSTGSQMNEYDQERLLTYLTAIRTYHAWVVAQPQLDLPETHPRVIQLEPPESTGIAENESVRDVITLLEIARDELVNGQSGRVGSGITPFDSNRLIAVIDKAENFLTDYIQQVTPLDLPESSPMRAITEPGKGGV